MSDTTITLLELDYHRNGVGGEGFFAARFTVNSVDGGGPGEFLAIIFDGPGQVAAVRTDHVFAEHGIKFGWNSWRGNDSYGPALREAIADYRALPLSEIGDDFPSEPMVYPKAPKKPIPEFGTKVRSQGPRPIEGVVIYPPGDDTSEQDGFVWVRWLDEDTPYDFNAHMEAIEDLTY